jgi:predicted Zn-dependent protease
MESFHGEFYDGQSSRKYKVSVTIDELNNKLIIAHETGEEDTWAIPDIRVTHTGDVTEVRPHYYLEKLLHITENNFRKEISRLLHAKNYDGWYHKLIYAGLAVHILIALSVLGIAAAVYWWVLPEVAEHAVSILPEEYDHRVGSNIYDNLIMYEEIDSSKTSLVKSFGEELKFNTERSPEIMVVKSKVQNAFAVPDGHIIIYSALLDSMDSYDELVALLSHESSHIKNRHSMKLLCRNLAGYLFLSVVFNDVNSIMAILADNANTLRSLQYSRGFEEEADMDGLQMMIDNHVDPEGMTRLFGQLKKAHDISIPAFISTHPLTVHRMEYIRKKIESSQFKVAQHSGLEKIFNEIKK